MIFFKFYRLYSELFKSEDISEIKDWLDALNPTSLIVMPNAIGAERFAIFYIYFIFYTINCSWVKFCLHATYNRLE